MQRLVVERLDLGFSLPTLVDGPAHHVCADRLRRRRTRSLASGSLLVFRPALPLVEPYGALYGREPERSMPRAAAYKLSTQGVDEFFVVQSQDLFHAEALAQERGAGLLAIRLLTLRLQTSISLWEPALGYPTRSTSRRSYARPHNQGGSSRRTTCGKSALLSCNRL